MRQKISSGSKWGIILFLSVILFSSCSKDPTAPLPLPQPEMKYVDLSGKEITQSNSITLDLDSDGKNDLRFHTLLVADPIAKQDKLQFYAMSLVESFLPVNANEEIPVMNEGDMIFTNNFSNFSWFEISSIVLVQKVTGIAGPSFWEGPWKNAAHKFLPIQVKVNQQRFNGWVELSMNIQQQRLVLHKAAICRQAGKNIKAGL